MRKTIKKNKQNPSKTKYRNIHMIGRPGAVKNVSSLVCIFNAIQIKNVNKLLCGY